MKNRWKELNKYREEFVKKFDINYIENVMKKDDYVIGKQSTDSFCYIIERGKLANLGSMRGANASKFGYYYGKNGKDDKVDYRATSKFTNKDEDSFVLVKRELSNLIKQVQKLNKLTNIESKFSDVFKYKIMFVYNPDIMLPIYAKEDLIHFITKLNKKAKKDYIKDQKILMDYRDEKFPNYNNFQFMEYLYKEYGKHDKEIQVDRKKDQDLNDILRGKSRIKEEKLKKGPILKPRVKKSGDVKYYPRNPKIAQISINKANGKCENCGKESFLKKDNKTKYFEAHHIIPMFYQDVVTNSLDVPENIICLCSECHNKIHYGFEGKKIVINLYRKRVNGMKARDIYIDEDVFSELYK